VYGPPPATPRPSGVPVAVLLLVAFACLAAGGIGGCAVGLAASSSSHDRATGTTRQATVARNGAQITEARIVNGAPGRTVVQATIKNGGDAPLKVNPFYFKAVASDQHDYPAAVEAATRFPGGDLVPGVSRSGRIAFKLPTGITVARIVFTGVNGEFVASAAVTR
jgi:hypothetical protein